MPKYGKDIYKGSIVWLKCVGGEICAVYQLRGTPPPPLVINLEVEDPDIAPLPPATLARVKQDRGLDFAATSFFGSDVPKTRVVPKRVFTRGNAFGMRLWLEGRVVWVDEPV